MYENRIKDKVKRKLDHAFEVNDWDKIYEDCPANNIYLPGDSNMSTELKKIVINMDYVCDCITLLNDDEICSRSSPDELEETREEVRYLNREIEKSMRETSIPKSGSVAELSDRYFSLVSKWFMGPEGSSNLSDITSDYLDL